jgi:hypothetical protein
LKKISKSLGWWLNIEEKNNNNIAKLKSRFLDDQSLIRAEEWNLLNRLPQSEVIFKK